MTDTIEIVAALIRDSAGRVLLVRKRGTTAFMQLGGKRDCRWRHGNVSQATREPDERYPALRADALLGGVWYYRAPDELKARLDALVGQNRW